MEMIPSVIIALSRCLKPKQQTFKQQIFNKILARTELQAGIDGESGRGVAVKDTVL